MQVRIIAKRAYDHRAYLDVGLRGFAAEARGTNTHGDESMLREQGLVRVRATIERKRDISRGNSGALEMKHKERREARGWLRNMQ